MKYVLLSVCTTAAFTLFAFFTALSYLFSLIVFATVGLCVSYLVARALDYFKRVRFKSPLPFFLCAYLPAAIIGMTVLFAIAPNVNVYPNEIREAYKLFGAGMTAYSILTLIIQAAIIHNAKFKKE